MEEGKRSAIRSCITNAERLIASGDKCVGENLPVAFHLYVLALEEVGKAAILKVLLSSEQRGSEDVSFFKNALNDHVRKMFWALWSGTIGTQIITKKQVEGHKSFAARIHGRRLETLYTQADGHEAHPLTLEEVTTFRSMVENRRRMEEQAGEDAHNQEKTELITWLEGMHRNPETRLMVWSQSSQEKLIQLQSVKLWISWLKEQFDQSARENAEIARRESQRIEPVGVERMKSKWKVRLTFVSESHSIRNNVLSYWNSHFPESVRFSPIRQDNSKIIVDLLMPKVIHASEVFPRTLFWSNRMLLSLSIGTIGHFWWYKPPHREKFYDKVIDLENDAELRLVRSPPLKVDWAMRSIRNEDISGITKCFALLPHAPSEPDWIAFDHYLQALTLIAKTDIHLGFQPSVFQNFLTCLSHLAVRFDGWNPKNGQTNLLRYMIDEVFPELSEKFDEMDRWVEFSNSYMEARPSNIEIEMDDFAKIKSIVDGYILRNFTVEFEKKFIRQNPE